MPESIFITAANLGATVFVTVAFLWYLLKTTNEQIRAQVELAKSLQRLSDMVENNTIWSVRNTVNSKLNTEAVEDNTVAVDKNTEVGKI